MIVGLGMDVVEIDRIERTLERFGEHFLRRVLTAEERAELLPISASSLAARFAAKEAAVKALGTGFACSIGMEHIAIHKDALGAPHLHLFGPAQARLQALGGKNTHISLTHSRNTAAAVVILES